MLLIVSVFNFFVTQATKLFRFHNPFRTATSLSLSLSLSLHKHTYIHSHAHIQLVIQCCRSPFPSSMPYIHGKKHRRSHGRKMKPHNSTVKSIWKVTWCSHFRSLKVPHEWINLSPKTSFFYFNTHISQN